jgi:hypothetical protein
MPAFVRVVQTGDWKKASDFLHGDLPKARQALGAGFRAEAKFLKKILVDGIKSQSPGGKDFKPLSATTLAVRKFLGIRGTKALIRTQSMIKEIRVTPFGRAGSFKYAVFVGILANAIGADGRSAFKKMVLSEFGGPPVIIPITPKMRAFLHAALGNVRALRKLGPPSNKGFLIVKVPARPVFAPVWNVWGRTSAARILNSARALYKGPFLPQGGP